MSRLKLSPNLFLEVNELNKLIDFLSIDGYKLIFKQLIKEYGIAQNADNTMFKVSHKTGTDNVVTINSGIAIDSNINIINLPQDIDITIPNTTNKQWLAVSYASTNNEIGTVNISAQGNLSGEGTKFLSVLRGQPNFPTKIKFSSNKNKEEYEVVDVTSDTEATLAGTFVEEKGINYQVIGTFTPGYQPNDDDKLIYEYDSFLIHVIDSVEKPDVDENTFIIACVEFENGINVIDERTNLFNNKLDIEGSETIINNNPFVSLIRTKLFNNRILDLQFEWGYKIHKCELTTTTTNNIIDILDGSSNYIPNTNIPDNIFNGWKLLNRKNMVSVDIDYNKSNSLYISAISSALITDKGDDFIVVPNFKDIEIEAKVSGSNYDDDAPNFYFKFSILNRKSRFHIPIEYLDTFIELKYRMINEENKTTTFQSFAVTQFENINNKKEILGDSSFSINVPEPEEVKRNYS